MQCLFYEMWVKLMLQNLCTENMVFNLQKFRGGYIHENTGLDDSITKMSLHPNLCTDNAFSVS